MNLKKVTVREVGPRDGFQMENKLITAEEKVKIINQLAAAGLKNVEFSSFVHPKAVPQLKDAEEVAAMLLPAEDVLFSALVVNEKGLARAVNAGVREVQMIVSASEAHSQRNVQMSVSESLSQAVSVAEQALGHGVAVRSAVAMAFGCPFDGKIDQEQVERIAAEMAEAGIEQITLADTAGLAHPLQVKELLHVLLKKMPGIRWGLHFHDTRGLALANINASMEVGVSLFESSIGGLGGCPFVPGATGNVATEDLVNMLEMMGLETGISLEKLLAASREVQKIFQRDLPSKLLALSLH